jgi:tyrosyl-tRNA synthetase
LTFGNGPTDALMMDNADWLLKLNYVDFLRDIGRHFSVNQMIQRDSVRLRLEREQHLSFLEFNYMLLQGYDFLEIYRRTGCRLQMGGSDQWGNILSGVDISRRLESVEALCPDLAAADDLVRRQDGQDRRRGRLAQRRAAVRLCLLAVLAQHRRCRCRERFLKLFTVLPMDEIAGWRRLRARKSTRRRRSWRRKRPP